MVTRARATIMHEDLRRLGPLFVAASLALACALISSSGARADEGEASFDLFVMPEVAFLAPPVGPREELLPFGDGTAVTFLPRVGGSVRYDVFNSFGIGLGVDGGAFPNVTAADTEIGGHSGELHSSVHAELCAPLILSYRFDSGYDVSGRVELHAGPALMGYLGNALGDPSRKDAEGLPSALPVSVADVWRVGGVARAVALFDARFFDLFVIAVGPYAGVSYAETVGLHFGLLVRASLTVGGPS